MLQTLLSPTSCSTNVEARGQAHTRHYNSTTKTTKTTIPWIKKHPQDPKLTLRSEKKWFRRRYDTQNEWIGECYAISRYGVFVVLSMSNASRYAFGILAQDDLHCGFGSIRISYSDEFLKGSWENFASADAKFRSRNVRFFRVLLKMFPFTLDGYFRRWCRKYSIWFSGLYELVY